MGLLLWGCGWFLAEGNGTVDHGLECAGHVAEVDLRRLARLFYIDQVELDPFLQGHQVRKFGRGSPKHIRIHNLLRLPLGFIVSRLRRRAAVLISGCGAHGGPCEPARFRSVVHILVDHDNGVGRFATSQVILLPVRKHIRLLQP